LAFQISNPFYETISPPGFGFQAIYWLGGQFTAGRASFIMEEERKYAAGSRDMKNNPEALTGKNIILIGMPGVGKSTVGVLLAKALSRDFLDTDVYIQAKEGRTLQEIIDREGLSAFCRIEEGHVRSLKFRASVIATGGSVVYYPAAMARFRSSGIVIHLDLALAHLKKRLTNLLTRGVVMAPGQKFDQLFDERLPLYRKYAHLTIDCAGCTHEEVVEEIIRRLKGWISHSPPKRMKKNH
jgi:shikimate kinase